MTGMRWIARVGILIVTLAGPAVAQQASGTGVLQGRILGRDGQPVVGAEVIVRGGAEVVRRSVVDAEGRFRLEVAAGRYALEVAAPAYEIAERQVAVEPGADVELSVVLEPTPVALPEMVVSAARTSAPVATIPGAVSVVGREQIAQQAGVLPEMGAVLSQLVPGLAAGTQSMSIYGQSFRGRNVAVLIDGVPQSTSRNVMRDFANIDPSAVERVEVLRGATAVYGDGATGGVINIVTRSAADGAMRFRTSVGADASLSAAGEGLGTRVSQSVSARRGALDYYLSGSLGRTGSFFDAQGDRIPSDPQGQGGVADFRSWNVLAKAGGTFGERRVELTVNRFDGIQDTEYTSDPQVDAAEPGSRKAVAQPGLRLEEPQGTENLNVTLGYREDGVLGGELRGQLFYRDYLTRFAPWDARSYLKHVTQSFVDSEKLGGRLELETALPIPTSPVVVWGVDYTDETTSQPVNTFDAEAYDASGGLVFEKTGEKFWVPPIGSRSVAVFGQFGWSPVERLSLRGGLRHERVRMHVDDFTTITGNAIVGGDLDYSPVLLNAGAVLRATDELSVFAAYSQGFSLADVGRVLRGAPAGFSLGSKDLNAQLVDHYETGVRAFWRRLELTASVFRNESELGTRLDSNLDVVRAPERIRGVEASADLRPSDALAVGGSFTWTEGESFFAKDGAWKALDGFRIQPLKLTGYVQHATRAGWTNRLQILHSGERTRAFEDRVGYGQTPIEAYTVLDWLTHLDVGPGTLDLSVHNLLNAEYFPVISQLYSAFGNSVHTMARGRTLSLGYSVAY